MVVIAPGDLLEIQIFKLLPRLTEAEILGVESRWREFYKALQIILVQTQIECWGVSVDTEEVQRLIHGSLNV